MRWGKTTKQKFEELMQHTPPAFAVMARAAVSQEAEKVALESNHDAVRDSDLVEALMNVTPEPFKAQMYSESKEVGLNIERYLSTKEIEKKYGLSWEDVEEVIRNDTFHIVWSVTDRCDSNCLHCVVSAAEDIRPDLPTRDMMKIIDNMGPPIVRGGYKPVFNFCGGEPTLRKDVPDLMAYARNKGYLTATATSGTLVTEEMIRNWKDINLSLVFVSLDSMDPEKNDWLRGRSGSYKAALRTIDLCKQYGLFTIVSMVAMKPNVHEIQDMKNFVEQELGVFFHVFIPVHAGRATRNWDQVGLSPLEYKEFYTYRYGEVVKNIREGNAALIPSLDIVDMVPFMEEIQSKEEKELIEWGAGCLACRQVLSLDVNGDIYSCKWPIGPVLGNAIDDDFETVIESNLYKRIQNRERSGPCASCHHHEICGGGCRDDSWRLYGDWFGSYTNCWHDELHDHENLER